MLDGRCRAIFTGSGWMGRRVRAVLCICTELQAMTYV